MTSASPIADYSALSSCLAGAKAALLVIDVQVDFVAPHGFCAQNGADVSGKPHTIERIGAALAVARAADIPICFIRLETSAETDPPAMLRLMTRLGQSGGAALCRAATPGCGYWGVAPAPGDHEIVKSRYDAFLDTPLDSWLRQRDIEVVVITGVSTDCCVDSTARAAFMRDYDVVVLGDACGAGSEAAHLGALSALGRYAATISDTDGFAAVMHSVTQ